MRADGPRMAFTYTIIFVQHWQDGLIIFQESGITVISPNKCLVRGFLERLAFPSILSVERKLPLKADNPIV